MGTQVTFAGLAWDIEPIPFDYQVEVEVIFLKLFGPAAGAGIAGLVQRSARSLVEAVRDITMGSGKRLTPFDTEGQALIAREHAATKRVGERTQIVVPTRINDDGDPIGEWRVISQDSASEPSDLRDALLIVRSAELREDDNGVWWLVTAPQRSEFRIGELVTVGQDDRFFDAWDTFLRGAADGIAAAVDAATSRLGSSVDAASVLRLFEIFLLGDTILVSDPEGKRIPAGHSVSLRDFRALSKLLEHDPAAKYELLREAIAATYGRKGGDDEGGDDGDDEGDDGGEG